MKRSAVQDLSPAPKRASDEDTSDDTTENFSDNSDESSDLEFDYIKSCEVKLPDELPLFQIARKCLVAMRAVDSTFFSLLSSDAFGCVLSALYGLANLKPLPLGALDLSKPPDDSVVFLTACFQRVDIKHANNKYYFLDAREKDQQIVSFPDSTCKFADIDDFEFGDPDAVLTNYNTKKYIIGVHSLELRTNEYVTIAECELWYEFPYGVVFSTNCVALVGMMDGDNHRVADTTVLYFGPDFKLLEKHSLGSCEFCRAISVDRDDNLYILADNDIDVYSVDGFEHIRNICVGPKIYFVDEFERIGSIRVGPTFGFCLTEDGGLVLARETRVDLYKNKVE